jgi:hypothetical protein
VVPRQLFTPSLRGILRLQCLDLESGKRLPPKVQETTKLALRRSILMTKLQKRSKVQRHLKRRTRTRLKAKAKTFSSNLALLQLEEVPGELKRLVMKLPHGRERFPRHLHRDNYPLLKGRRLAGEAEQGWRRMVMATMRRENPMTTSFRKVKRGHLNRLR